MGSTDAAVPFWHVNVPEAQRTASCPDFLARLSDKDRRIIATPDADYRIQSWNDVRQVVRDNRLELFQRVPSELRRYKAFTWRLARDYGSVPEFILRQRLGWETPVRPRGNRPFQCADDFKILYNDWPYGIDPRIVHLVVWTKFPLEEDPQTEDLTDEARRQIGEFMEDTFFKDVSESQVIWFKNWAALKSVNALEHFHVMLFDPDPEFIKFITNGDVPQCQKPDP